MSELLLKSCLNIDELKVGDHIFTPFLSKENSHYVCNFREFKITKFFSNSVTKIKFDKDDVELEEILPLDNKDKDKNKDKDANKCICNLKKGFCIESTKKDILKLFTKEIDSMLTAINDADQKIKLEDKND